MGQAEVGSDPGSWYRQPSCNPLDHRRQVEPFGLPTYILFPEFGPSLACLASVVHGASTVLTMMLIISHWRRCSSSSFCNNILHDVSRRHTEFQMAADVRILESGFWSQDSGPHITLAFLWCSPT